MIKWIKDGESIESIHSKIDEKMQEDKVFEYAKDALNGDVYGNVWCRPLLATIEYNLTDESKQTFIDLDKVQVEHILPQQYKNQKSWQHITDEVARRYLNTVGNITLLSGYKNVVAANLGLAQKIDIYKKDKKTGISAFEMTRLVISDFESGKYNKEWNEVAIKDRYAWFCSQIYEIFNLNIK